MELNTCLLLNQRAIMQAMYDLCLLLGDTRPLAFEQYLKTDFHGLRVRISETNLRIQAEDRR